jgi:hypothetical protein
MVLGVIFDGLECVFESGCDCEPDCDHFYGSIEACEMACGVLPPLCPTVLPPYDYGDCDAVLGTVFNGSECIEISGCDCEPDCDLFFPDYATCMEMCFWD